MDLDWKSNLINELKNNNKSIENNPIYNQILNTFDINNNNVTRLLKEFYIDIPTNIYINHHKNVYDPDSPYGNIDNIMILNNIDRFITILSLYDTSLTDTNSSNYDAFLSLNKDLLVSLQKDNDEIKGGGATTNNTASTSAKKNKHIIINDGGNKRYVLVKNNKYQILNETNTEYLLSTNNRGIIRMKK